MKSKTKKPENSRNSEEIKNKTKSDIIKKNNQNLTKASQDPDKFLKNVNEFRHIMMTLIVVEPILNLC